MGVGRGLVLLLDGGDLGPQAFEFGVERRLSGKQLRELGVFFGKLGFELL